MSTTTPTDGAARPRRSAGSWRAWLAPAAILLAIAALTLPRWFTTRGSDPARLGPLTSLDPVPIRISPELRPSGVVPAAPGSLAGCNLLLVTMDTTRADRIGCYGNPDVATPTVDRVAREGVLFSNVVAVAPTTLPAHSAMLTGLYPIHHGARANCLFTLSDDSHTLAEVLSAQGYATGAFVSAWVLSARYGISAGFADFDEPEPEHTDDAAGGEEADDDPAARVHVQRPANETSDGAIAWLRTHAGGPFFLWVHYYDPHFPYEPPSPFAESYTHRYEGEIAFTDSEAGRLLAVLDETGHTEDTLVVLAGDHGEGVGQHHEWTHCYLLYESTQHVPMVMRCGSRLGGGVRIDRDVSHVDVMPTVLSLLGVECPPGVDGLDLTQPAAGPRRLFAETNGLEAGLASLRAVREWPMKYIHGPIPELFDLAQDPFEEHDLLASKSDVAESMRQVAVDFFGAELDQAATATKTLSAEERAALAALGYAGDLGGGGELKDPKVVIRATEMINIAQTRPLEERISLLEQAVRDFPDYPAASFHLARAYKDAGDTDRAAKLLEDALATAPDNPSLLIALAEIRAKQGDTAAAEKHYRRILDIAPTDLDALAELGALLAQRGEYAEAAPLLTQAFHRAPNRELLRQNMVNLCRITNQIDQAITLLGEALRRDPDLDAVRDDVFALLQQERRFAEAADTLRRVLQARPQKLDVANNLAALLAAAPDPDVHDPAEAVSVATWMCIQNGHKDPRYLFTLSIAHWAAGDIDDARRVGEQAYRAALETGQQELAATIRARVQTFGQTGQKLDDLLVPVEPVPTRIASDFRPSPLVPAEPGSLAGCSLLLITLDTARADRFGCYGSSTVQTPSFDRLARQGVLFSQVTAVAPSTLPSHSSMLTGLYPIHHGARANGLFRLEDDVVTLAEVLSTRGYATGAFVSASVLGARFGVAAGFAEFDEVGQHAEAQPPGGGGPATAAEEVERAAGETNRRAVPWLRAHANGPFFLWVHFFDPHRPYEPPAPFAEQYAHPYDGEIAYADSEIGRLLAVLDEIGRTNDTLVVVASDHGDGLGQHREWTHSYLLYEATQHVPLVMCCGRRLGGGVRVDRPASLVDIMPTVLSLLGVDCPSGLDGVDLTRPGPEERPIFAETCAAHVGLASLRSVRDGFTKYVHGPMPELFDLAQDPLEERNLYETHTALAQRMKQQLEAFFGNELEQSAPPTMTPDAQEQAKLNALGYVSDSVAAIGPLPDPKAIIREVERVTMAVGLPPDQRVAELEAAVRDHPQFAMAYTQLAKVLTAAGDRERAAQVLADGLRVAPGNPKILLDLGDLRAWQQDATGAEECYRRVVQIAPDNPEALAKLGALLARRQAFDEAADMLVRAFRLAPRQAALVDNLLGVLQATGQSDRAIQLLDEALQAHPYLTEVRKRLLALLKHDGRLPEAEQMLRRTLRARPNDADVADDLAELLGKVPASPPARSESPAD